jgi:hypothetical protein
VCIGPIKPTVFTPDHTLTLHGHSALQRAVSSYCTLIVVFLTLKEGPTTLNKLVGCDPDALRIGQAARLLFKPSVGE